MMFSILLLIALLSAPKIIIGEAQFEIIPLRLDLIIERIRDFNQQYPENLNNLVDSPFASIQSDAFLKNMRFRQNQSTSCERDLEILLAAATERQSWAIKVLDAWGKPLPSGILKGNLFWLGNYEECVNPLYQLNNKSFVSQPINTQYCVLTPSPSNQQGPAGSGLILGTCLPASCTRQLIIKLIHEQFNGTKLTLDNLHCSNDRANEQSGPSSGTIVFVVVLSFLVLLVLIGTITDLIFLMYIMPNQHEKSHANGYRDLSEENSNKSVSLNIVNRDLPYIMKQMPVVAFLAEFSAIRTLRHTFAINKENENSFSFLNGIRVLSLFWVIVGHSFGFPLSYTSNILDLLSTLRNFAFQLLISGVFSVDTFFLLSGFLTAILFIRLLRKENLSIRLMVLYYIHRYVRLTPAFVLVMFVSIYLTPYFGQGPLYPVQQGFESKGCRDGHWWTSFLYIGNFFKSQNMCLGVTWYLFNDMQFHWVAPIALIPFVMGRKAIGYIVAVSFVLISIGSILGLLLYYPSLVGNFLDANTNTTGPNFFDKIYMTPWCRIAPYAFGLLTGFIVSQTGRHYQLNRSVQIIGNILATTIALACIFGTYGDYIMVPGLSRASLIAYQALSRPAWSVSVSWLVFICSINQGGIVNRILSFPIWIPLARLNYAAYLIHSTVIFITISNQSVPFYYQPTTFLNNFVSELFFSYLAAILVVIFFETPFVILEKKLLKR